MRDMYQINGETDEAKTVQSAIDVSKGNYKNAPETVKLHYHRASENCLGCRHTLFQNGEAHSDGEAICTVGDLKKLLAQMPDELKVFLGQDGQEEFSDGFESWTGQWDAVDDGLWGQGIQLLPDHVARRKHG
jgi:hypothetical protein